MTVSEYLMSKGCVRVADEHGYIFKFNDEVVLCDDVTVIIAPPSKFFMSIVDILGTPDYVENGYSIWETGL